MMKHLFLHAAALCLIGVPAWGQSLLLPTDNRSLFEQPSGFFQFVDRNFEGAKTSPWEGGQFGFVRDPRRLGSKIAYARFHEGLDIKPLQRDASIDH